MTEVDRFPVEGETPVEQNGNLCIHIGNKPYKIEKIFREPEDTETEPQEWVVIGDW